jgi:hypothetical protein
MKFVNWLVSVLVTPGHLVAEFTDDTLRLPEWVGGIAGMAAVAVWVVFLLVVAYNLATSAILFFV